jgi:hypothetical protein
MSGFELLLKPGCTKLPECRCGHEMEIAQIELFLEGQDADVRFYECSACLHVMRLTLWAAPNIISDIDSQSGQRYCSAARGARHPDRSRRALGSDASPRHRSSQTSVAFLKWNQRF